MRRLAWVTDPHLNFLTVGQFATFARRVLECRADALLLGGDIAEAPTVAGSLDTVQEVLNRLAPERAGTPDGPAMPVYFVLGNHDYYGGSIAGVRTQMAELCRRETRLTYLTTSEVVSLTPETALIGHDGWGDGGAGNAQRSTVALNDFTLIRELKGLRREARLAKLHALGEEAAGHLRRVLPKALKSHPQALLLTHVAPFAESAWHRGRPSEPDWQPFFVCAAAGRALREIMDDHPHRQLTVLCGHTHGSGTAQVRPNLRVLTAGADYGVPATPTVLEVA